VPGICLKNYSNRFAWRSTLFPAMDRAYGGAAGNARQPFRWAGRRCRQCQAAISRGAAALAVSPERVVAGFQLLYLDATLHEYREATTNTGFTRCIIIFCRSMVCIHTVKSSGILQCVLVIRESFTKEYGLRVLHSSLCGPLFLQIKPNQPPLITRTQCNPTINIPSQP